MAEIPRIMERMRARLAGQRPRPTVPIVVCGREPGEGWRILLMRGGEVQASLDAGAARLLAEQLTRAAETIGGKPW